MVNLLHVAEKLKREKAENVVDDDGGLLAPGVPVAPEED